MPDYSRRTGLVPDLGTQAAVAAIEASIAHGRARRQAARGVAPALAERHGVQASNAILAYWIFIAPVTAFSFLFAMAPPFGTLCFGPLAAIGLIIGVRLKQWLDTPADRRLVYRIPTWAFVVIGGVWVAVLAFCMLAAFVAGV